MAEPTTGVNGTVVDDDPEIADYADDEYGADTPSEYTTETAQDAPARAVARRPVVTGHATPSAVFPLTESATATIGGTPAMVSFAGLTPGFVGLYQANIVIPNVAAGSHPMVITIGATASNTTNINTK